MRGGSQPPRSVLWNILCRGECKVNVEEYGVTSKKVIPAKKDLFVGGGSEYVSFQGATICGFADQTRHNGGGFLLSTQANMSTI